MGLIKQIDDQLGVLFRFMEQRGLLDNTLIVFTSDHGDYLGDHWMGEKDLFHEPSVKVPLIVCDPSAEADAARGTVCDALVETIDLVADVPGGPGRRPGRAIAPARGPLADAVPARLKRRPSGAALPSASTTIRMLPVRGEARHRAARRAPVHGGGQALEVRACAGFPADAVRPGKRPQRVPRPRRRSGLRGERQRLMAPRWPSGACAYPSARRARNSR